MNEIAGEDIRRAIAEIHGKQQNVGVAVAIRHGSQTALSVHMGLADLEHHVPVGPNTRFGIASLTKLFTAATLLRLRASGRIDLDAPIQRYIQSFPEKPEGEITIRMLATHLSGIPHPQKRTPELFASHYELAMDTVSVFADDQLVAPPGSRRVYSSSNNNLLAAAIESVTSQRFPEIVRQEILDALDLSSTGFDDVLRPIPHRARRYSFYHPWTYMESQQLFVVPTWDYSFNMGGGNMISTADDIVRLGQAFVDPGLLPRRELELLFDEQWFGQQDKQGRRLLHITGANPGVQAGLAIYPEEQIVVAVLSNTWGIGSNSGEMVELAKRLAEMSMNR